MFAAAPALPPDAVHRHSGRQHPLPPPVRRYDAEGQPGFASARLWDDGVIRPQDSRAVLGLSLATAMSRGPRASRFGVFRM